MSCNVGVCFIFLKMLNFKFEIYMRWECYPRTRSLKVLVGIMDHTHMDHPLLVKRGIELSTVAAKVYFGSEDVLFCTNKKTEICSSQQLQVSKVRVLLYTYELI